MCKLKIAEQQSGGEGFVTVEDLKTELNTDAWEDLGDESTVLYRFLTSSIFKNKTKKQKDDQIDVENLGLFALLHCPGNPQDKAEYLYSVIRHGNTENHPFIAA